MVQHGNNSVRNRWRIQGSLKGGVSIDIDKLSVEKTNEVEKAETNLLNYENKECLAYYFRKTLKSCLRRMSAD